MRCLITVLRLRLKAALCSGLFWLFTLSFLCIAGGLALLAPSDQPAGVLVGILPLSDAAQDAAEQLADNRDYQFIPYADEDALRHDVTAGRLHCGYLLAENGAATLLKTANTYLDPLLDEIVLAAQFEGLMPQLAQETLLGAGLDPGDTQTGYQRQRANARPMSVELTITGSSPQVLDDHTGGMRRLLDATLLSVFFAIVLLQALVSDPRSSRALETAGRLTGHRAACSLAPAAANTLLFWGALVSADLILERWYQPSGQPVLWRLFAFLLAAVFSALLFTAATALHRAGRWLVYLLPGWALLSVLASGAVIDFSRLSGGLALLRYLSPAWYFLQLLW